MISGFLRQGGRKGIRNVIVVVYLVECAHHVARRIAQPFEDLSGGSVHIIDFPGCFANAHADAMLRALTTHPNVGAALLISHGCEGFDAPGLKAHIVASGRPVEVITIQRDGGTRDTIAAGRAWVETTQEALKATPKVDMQPSELVVGSICGGADETSPLTADPAMGGAFDLPVNIGATCLIGTGKLDGFAQQLADRAMTTPWAVPPYPMAKRPKGVSMPKPVRRP